MEEKCKLCGLSNLDPHACPVLCFGTPMLKRFERIEKRIEDLEKRQPVHYCPQPQVIYPQQIP